MQTLTCMAVAVVTIASTPATIAAQSSTAPHAEAQPAACAIPDDAAETVRQYFEAGMAGEYSRLASLKSSLSVMPIGRADCVTSFANRTLGKAPFFRREVPSGKHELTVLCPDGATFVSEINVPPHGNELVIIRPNMWTKP